uniref:Urocanate hydratase n=1 Tax=Strigamia maritima TaxID=126957 RepID=T1J844_STRMM
MDGLQTLQSGIPLHPLPKLESPRDESIPHAPTRIHNLTKEEENLAIKNALRYFPEEFHSLLVHEFTNELKTYGHIYMYRFMPKFPLRAYPIQYYPTKIVDAAAIVHMILNNLDPEVAQFPQELVTYGGNGQVFSNWAQFWLVMKYLCNMSADQTLVLNSGHPLGLFPSNQSSPRMIICNGMVIPNYSSRNDYDRLFALGVTQYGQMTAGCFCYIGSQGIVHGTVLTLLNAGRKYLNLNSLAGKVYVSSGLGGMSGAQAKAATITGCLGIIAEVNYSALKKRLDQQWLDEIVTDLDKVISKIREAKRTKKPGSIGYHGNIVDLLIRLVAELEATGECLVDMASDQTSCHNPFNGGYYPYQLTYEEAEITMRENPTLFEKLVRESLCEQIKAINVLTDKGMKFWDYGNAFLLEASRAGGDVDAQCIAGKLTFRYPSYMQDIMGEIFALGFGPFRWICTSGRANDLAMTDQIALDLLQKLQRVEMNEQVKQQYEDNIKWIREAAVNNLVVGSQARILYSDQVGRVALAKAFNTAIRDGKISAPIVLSRDHHDVSGTDSPYRETSNITDGSAFTADMAVQNCIGDAFRGATWVALHNGGGVGWGEVINGGFGLVLDGKNETDDRIAMMLNWDVTNGVARRSWSGDLTAQETIQRAMRADPNLQVTLPHATKLKLL